MSAFSVLLTFLLFLSAIPLSMILHCSSIHSSWAVLIFTFTSQFTTRYSKAASWLFYLFCISSVFLSLVTQGCTFFHCLQRNSSAGVASLWCYWQECLHRCQGCRGLHISVNLWLEYFCDFHIHKFLKDESFAWTLGEMLDLEFDCCHNKVMVAVQRSGMFLCLPCCCWT